MKALSCPQIWQEFFDYKLAGGHMSNGEEKKLADFIEGQAYLPVIDTIERGTGFAPPHKKIISKLHSTKKRVVYVYSEEENRVLKFLTYLLQKKYDYLYADNLYSFRQGVGAHDAIKRLVKTPGIGRMWSYKVDISNYFNSIPVSELLKIMRDKLRADKQVCDFLETLLLNPWVIEDGVQIKEEKGIMAGTPVSTFLANLYLCHMDHYFQNENVIYARYSDDIIVFAETKDQLDEYVRQIQSILLQSGLSINADKEAYTAPGEKWTFLGFSYQNGTVDISPISVDKMKAKMRRKARALERWRVRKNIGRVQAARAFIKVFNKKLFENPAEHELTWTRWYFPMINTTESLKIIDEYSQYNIRVLATGKHTKAAYNFRYEEMKELGYVTLVNAYYSFLKEKDGTKEKGCCKI